MQADSESSYCLLNKSYIPGVTKYYILVYHETNTFLENDCLLGFYSGQPWVIAMMMEAIRTAETLLNFYQTARRNIPLSAAWTCNLASKFLFCTLHSSRETIKQVIISLKIFRLKFGKHFPLERMKFSIHLLLFNLITIISSQEYRLWNYAIFPYLKFPPFFWNRNYTLISEHVQSSFWYSRRMTDHEHTQTTRGIITVLYILIFMFWCRN